ncbi:MAG: hypothetical protein N3A55_09495 [Methylohalobius sp.]|nr:hypothetical protein [Methylohalobius sp.]
MLALMGLSACAARPPKPVLPDTAAYVSRPEFSRAMNVLIAAGIVPDPETSPVRDGMVAGGIAYIPPGYTYYKLNLPDPKALKTSHGELAAANLGLTAAGLVRSPTGIAPGVGLAMGALWLLSSGEQDPREVSGDHPLSQPLLIGWDKEPDRWFAHWTRAVLESLTHLDPALGYHITLVPELKVRFKKPAWLAFLTQDPWQETTLKSDPEFGIAKITGHRCDQVVCFYYPDEVVGRTFFFHLKWPLDRAPDFLSGFAPAVLVLDDIPKDLIEPASWLYDNSQIEDPEFPFFELFKNASAYLPESYFIYLPPGISLGPGRGKTDFPVVLHRGEELKFEPPKEVP